MYAYNALLLVTSSNNIFTTINHKINKTYSYGGTCTSSPHPWCCPGVTLYPDVCHWIRHKQSTITVTCHSEYTDLLPVLEVVILLHVTYYYWHSRRNRGWVGLEGSWEPPPPFSVAKLYIIFFLLVKIFDKFTPPPPLHFQFYFDATDW